MDEAMMAMMGFGGFGTQKKKENRQIKIVAPLVSMQKPGLQVKAGKDDKGAGGVSTVDKRMVVNTETPEDEEDSDDDSEDIDLRDRLPFASYCSLSDHSRSVTSMSVDPAGSRLITGSRDNYVKLWDFSTMRGNFKPFHTIEPAEGSPIRDLQWGIKGDCFLVAPSNWQPMLFDRDGTEVCAFSKGDPYLRDLKNVKGHTSALTCGRWDPNDMNLFMTASYDSTIKVWDINNRQSCRFSMFTPAKGAGDRYAITAAAYTGDGKRIIAADMNGQIKIWSSNGTQTRALQTIANAHVKQTGVTSVTMSLNNVNFVSRCMDDTLKLWDTRNPSKPVGVQEDLSVYHEEANCIYSPNERYVLTGTAAPNQGIGFVAVFDAKTLEPVAQVELPSSCVRLMWPNKMEQLFCGMGDGQVRVHIDPDFSQGGVITPLLNANKKLTVDDYDKFVGGVNASGEILEPDIMDPANIVKSTWTRDRNLRKPEQLHTSGAGKKGLIGMNTTQYIMKNLLTNNTRLEDPRDAILKHAEAAATPAYKKNQKNVILADSVFEDKAEEYRESKKQRRK